MMEIQCFFLLMLGSAAGSSIHCCASRYAHDQPYLFAHSRCDSCKHRLKWWQMIPVISYLWQKGKCFYCGKRIDPEVFYYEIGYGLCFAALGYAKASIMSFCFVSAMGFLGECDRQTLSIPYPDTLFWLGVGMLLDGCYGYPERLFLAASWYGLGIIVAGLWERIWHKPVMGEGDKYLLAMVFLYFPLPQSIMVVLLGSLAGLWNALISRQQPIPFGYCLWQGALIALFIRFFLA